MKVDISVNKDGCFDCKVKIENHDIWSIDWTLSKIILPLLKKFKMV